MVYSESSSFFLGFWSIVLLLLVPEEPVESAMVDEFLNLVLELDALLHIVAMIIVV